MKRLLAMLLLSAIGFLPFGSAFASLYSEHSLPVCCRISGKHHCAIRSAFQESSRKSGLRSESDQCPFAPVVSSATISLSAFPVPAPMLTLQGITYRLVTPEQAGGLVPIIFDRSSQKRGPPVFSLL
jgi:hypothetical protein